jgi:hypothetical protein
MIGLLPRHPIPPFSCTDPSPPPPPPPATPQPLNPPPQNQHPDRLRGEPRPVRGAGGAGLPHPPPLQGRQGPLPRLQGGPHRRGLHGTFVCLSVCLPVCLSVCLSACACVDIYVCVFFPSRTFVRTYARMSVCACVGRYVGGGKCVGRWERACGNVLVYPIQSSPPSNQPTNHSSHPSARPPVPSRTWSGPWTCTPRSRPPPPSTASASSAPSSPTQSTPVRAMSCRVISCLFFLLIY